MKGSNILLRPFRDEDWQIIDEWGNNRNALWGPYQRYQLDHIPLLRQAYNKSNLLTRESGMLLIETLEAQEVVGFVRYTLLPYPDADYPCPEIGFGITSSDARGKGYAKQALQLLVDYLFAGYATQRILAFTEEENSPAQGVLEGVGFQREGALRQATFRDGEWRDMVIYGLLRMEWN